ALDFGRPEQYQYAYMLEGFDTVWTYSGSRRAVSYTNIPGGDYVFKVKATTVEGDWNVAEAKIPIYINTPFYKKWWFILCTALILLLSLI
ncbi:triple tyrosine motif-containing protein, partial [Acinetobacter baumannii]